MTKTTKEIRKPGRSKYPLDLIQEDYIIKRLKFRELVIKYGISRQLLAYYSSRGKWLEKREEHFTRLSQASLTSASERLIKEDILSRDDRISMLKEIISELRDEIKGAKAKSKETLSNAIVEAGKHIEVLEGGFSDRVELKSEEKQERLNRLRERLNFPLNNTHN